MLEGGYDLDALQPAPPPSWARWRASISARRPRRPAAPAPSHRPSPRHLAPVIAFLNRVVERRRVVVTGTSGRPPLGGAVTGVRPSLVVRMIPERFAACGRRVGAAGRAVRRRRPPAVPRRRRGARPVARASRGPTSISTDDRCSPAPDQGAARGLGGCGVDPGRERSARSAPSGSARMGREDDRDHDVPGRGLHRRLAQAAGDVRRRRRGRPRPPRLHDQRDGAGADDARRPRCSSIRTAAPSTW